MLGDTDVSRFGPDDGTVLGIRLPGLAGATVVDGDSRRTFTVEFAVKLATSGGVVIANTSAEANLSVTLKWTRDQPPADPVIGPLHP